MGMGICLFIGKTVTIALSGIALITALIIALILGIKRYIT
jgi:hypothetical protein